MAFDKLFDIEVELNSINFKLNLTIIQIELK